MKSQTYTSVEHHLYAAARLGMETYQNITLADVQTTTLPFGTFVTPFPVTVNDEFAEVREVKMKRYELNSHQSSVHITISDRKLSVPQGSTTHTAFYTADVVSYGDYYSFGMLKPGRHSDPSEQRYGYQGSERTPELNDNHYTTEFRELDTRIGRWWSRDAIVKRWESPYAAMHNNPIFFSDRLGLDPPEKFSGGQRFKNWISGQGYKNRANAYAVEHGIDESRIKEGKGFIMIDESYVVGAESPEEGYQYDAEFIGSHKYFHSGKAKNHDYPVPNMHDCFCRSDDPGVTSLGEMSHLALYKFKELELKGELRWKAMNEPEVIDFTFSLANRIFGDERYGNEEFFIYSEADIEFGPPRGEGWLGYFPPAAYTNTWTLRHAGLTADAIIEKNGNIHIHFHAQDTWDLTPGANRGWLYNAITGGGGFFWHGVMGASKPTVKANWIYVYDRANNRSDMYVEP